MNDCRRDERGAIMLIALFFAVFAVGLVYYLVGMSQAVLVRERLGGAADAAALGSAVMHARAMNFVVLVNIVMAVLLAILVAIKVVESLAMLGMAIAAGLAFFTGGASLAAIPPLESIRSEVHTAYEEVKDPVFEALETLHSVQQAVKTLAPPTGNAIASDDLKEHFRPTVTHGFAAGTRLELPIEDESFDYLCGKAGEYAAKLGLKPLEPLFNDLPGTGRVKKKLESGVGALTSSFSDWFCGDSSGGASPPAAEDDVDVWSPIMPDEEACSELAEGGGDPEEVAEICSRSHTDAKDGKPHKDTGACRSGSDCSIDGPYELRAAAAREQCQPTSTDRPVEYVYQERRGEADYRFNGEAWEFVERRHQAPRREDTGTRPPCGPEYLNPKVATGYNLEVHPLGDVTEILPVCTTEEPPETTLDMPSEGDVRTVDFVEVSHILGCRRVERKVFEVDAEQAGDGGTDKSPQRVQEAIALGDEAFQIRAIVRGSGGSRTARRIVKVTLWGDEPPENPLQHLESLGRHGVAQAEYYYDAHEPRDAWMWNMKWRARLKRFRLPVEDDPIDALQTACEAPLGSECSGILASFDQLSNVVAH